MMKELVTYFSASGVTKNLAKRIASVLGADLKEIEPVERYTDADLNWMDKKSRSSVEMKDLSSRPEIKDMGDLSNYDCIYVGFPVWWYREPSIIDTFLESYDFSGKKIVLFATSGGSGINGAIKNCKTLKGNLNIVDGKRLSSSASDDELLSLRNI
ncbi:MAG: flavodoxin [Bacilli bacterium]|nr:flavodoxin [Bacilli bacterium]